MSRTGAAIEARELTKTYGGGVRALDGLGFTVEAGTVFGLLGPTAPVSTPPHLALQAPHPSPPTSQRPHLHMPRSLSGRHLLLPGE